MSRNSSSTLETARAARPADIAKLLVTPRAGEGFAAIRAGMLPDRGLVLHGIDRLHGLLVPEALPGAGENVREVEADIAEVEALLASQIRLALDFDERLHPDRRSERELDAASQRIAGKLIAALPELRERLFEDAEAAWRGDPSCRDPVEALYAFPGVFAITRHRIAHLLYGEGVPLLPRLVSEHAHRKTGIDIHPGATIGRHIFIDHGTGVVIGETAVIGDRVTLYQGVTLGAKSFQVDAAGHLVKGKPRHPVLEDGVTLYASATVLGRVTIGAGSVIGGNVWLTHSVPPGTRVYQVEAKESHFESGAGI
jgi:serine O-acetyltransferase